MSFVPGSLVRARNREWVVLPDSDDDLVIVRPLGGADVEVTGILTALEPVEPATFSLPDPAQLGDFRSARLLRDAMRLGFRSSAGPFRSVANIAVTPRPYQLVPLLMALKLDPVRLLIADDVGIGKTIEASLIAKELLAQGEANRLCVLCPPHLAEQWQAELADKFHIEAELVLASTAAQLERGLPHGRSIFDAHPYTVVSIDFIKSDRRRNDFIRACPKLVIVDEAHTCADAGESVRSARHQRHQLVRDLASDDDRHLILVTATPHSGKEGAFRSLLGLLDPAFEQLPDELTGDANRHHREQLARHLVQRRRHDIRHYLETDTSFPDRKDLEATYELSSRYREVFGRVLDYARETVRDPESGGHRQRVRWWSALGLLRALASSPAAAAATMRTRAANADAETVDEADEIGRQAILDLDEAEDAVDVVPGSDTEDAASSLGKRLRALANEVDQLRGADDAKLVKAVSMIADLVRDGFSPIVFCRFIDTAEYLAEELRGRLPSRSAVEVEVVTGRLPAAERVERVDALTGHDRRVLVATDCLSEGVNLQASFDAVVHYDLPWNPTRLEQREGRVDRFGQSADEVRVVTYYGSDNQIDETVLDVLVRKHRKIRSALGVSLPVPGDSGEVINALAENVLLRSDGPLEERLPGFDDYLRPHTEQLHLAWDAAEQREVRARRSIFAQETIHPDEVAAELMAMQAAVGSGADVRQFVASSLAAYKGAVGGSDPATVALAETPSALRDAIGVGGSEGETLMVRFDLPVPDGVVYLSRTHPVVAGLATYVLDEALDGETLGAASRCGVSRTDAVDRRTTLLLCRFRVQLVAERRGDEHLMLAEDAGLVAFTGPPEAPVWLSPTQAEALLAARPTGNIDVDVRREMLGDVLGAEATWRPELDAEARRRAEATVDAHRRVRKADARRGVTRTARYRAVPQLPVDVLGVYVFLPDVTR